jgi:hypothetical protein
MQQSGGKKKLCKNCARDYERGEILQFEHDQRQSKSSGWFLIRNKKYHYTIVLVEGMKSWKNPGSGNGSSTSD